MLLSSSGIFLVKFLRPLTPHSLILDDGGEGVLDTNLTGERGPDHDRGEGDFIMDLDLDPEPEGDFDLSPDFDEAVVEAGPGGSERSSSRSRSSSVLSLGSTEDDPDLDEYASQ